MLWNEKVKNRKKKTLFLGKKGEISSLSFASYLPLSAKGYLKTEFIFFKAKGRPFQSFPDGPDHLVSNLGDVSNCLSRDYQPMLLTNPQSRGTGESDVAFIYRWGCVKAGSTFLLIGEGSFPICSQA